MKSSLLKSAQKHAVYDPRPGLGNEPPIATEGPQPETQDRRRVSLRWLSGTILTGLSGAMLIASATWTVLKSNAYVAEQPTFKINAHKDDRGGTSVNQKKGDRLVKAVDIVAAHQTFRAPTIVRVGDKEVIRNMTYDRVATPLVTSSVGLADDVPVFNPMKLMSAARTASEAGQDTLAADDADVAFLVRDLPSLHDFKPTAELTPEETLAQVQEFLKTPVSQGNRTASSLPAQMLLMRTSRASPLGYAAVGDPTAPFVSSAPFESIEVKMVPENVTLISKSPSAQNQPTQMDERLAVIKRGETLEDALRSEQVPKAQIATIIEAFGGPRKVERIAQEGWRVKLLFVDMDGSGVATTLARVSIHSQDRVEGMAAITDDGRYVEVSRAENASAPLLPSRSRDDEDADADNGGMPLYNALYETALKQNVPKAIIDELVRIFANDVDFQRSVNAGDSFEAFYDESDDRENKYELLFASITARNDVYRYYRFQTGDDGLIDYYDENGRSTRKFLIRKPIANGETRSGFGYRRHPIFGYYKMHTGVDWSAPIGTPIVAAGNGVVIEAGWHSGYGRRIEVQHANGYVTAYNHLSGFARGVSEGARVRQGQVIGFLGNSGLSTGPHLHYEVMVNGHFVDPLRVKLARTREFDGRLLADFKRERERIDQLMAKAPNATHPLKSASSN